MTLNAMFRYPELYKAGISVASVPDQRLSDTIYQERYMGLPQANPEGYKNGSPVTFAKDLKGKLLVVHGTGDDNVHYQCFELLVNELVAHNKAFAMMSYPNRSHGISEGAGTTVHLYKMFTRFLNENLPPGPRARGGRPAGHSAQRGSGRGNLAPVSPSQASSLRRLKACGRSCAGSPCATRCRRAPRCLSS